MAAEDELALPQVPEAQPEDPEDVSWALSTAEAMWARGDHLEGIKWVRKAAEAASDVENDERALELAKAASELTTLIARRSRASIPEGGGLAGGAPPEAMPNSVPVSVPIPMSAQQPRSVPPTSGQPQSAKPPSIAPQTSRMGNAPPLPPTASSPPPAPVPAPLANPVTSPSRPPTARSVPPGPIPLPSHASSPPKAPSQTPQARAAPRPLATNDTRQGPQPGRGVLSNRTAPAAPKAKGRRRSRENLEAEAQAAGVLETSPLPAVDTSGAERALDQTMTGEHANLGAAVEVPVQNARVRRRSRPDPDPTVVASLDELAQAGQREKSAEEWDASPTQNLSGDEMDHMNLDHGDRKTALVQLPVPVVPPMRAPAGTVHDPEIQTSQAVRVVVWRDGNGVHVAPAGTVVSSITIDAVLVVLEPSADLTAWLSQR